MLESVGRWLEKGELLDTIAPCRRTLLSWVYFYRASSQKLPDTRADCVKRLPVWSRLPGTPIYYQYSSGKSTNANAIGLRSMR
jgi:hypothetical protein